MNRRGRLAFVLGFGLVVGCSSADYRESSLGYERLAVVVPAKGGATTLDVGSWNVEWFGDSGNGPSNEGLQLSNARDVINGSDMDVWGVAEIVSSSAFANLKSQLPGYAGLLASDAGVVSGSAYYGSTEQKVGVLYKTSIASVQDARIILTGSDSDFAGRPPLQVTLGIALNGTTENVIVIVLHSKCCSDQTSWQRRVNASNALKAYLDSNFPSQKVWVVGDFNDDVDTSIDSGQASPYANFVGDTARYRFPTKSLSDLGLASTTDYPDMIDHHLLSNEANALYLSGSVEVYRVDSFISGYSSSTSDHYPVLSRYSWGGAGSGGSGGAGGSGGTGGTAGAGGSGGGSAEVVINEVLANEPGSNTAGEFIELVNAGTAAASIGGWTLRDSSSTRHTFASGTSLAPGQAIVVFGSASAIPSGTPNAVAASSGDLNLANGGDAVTLRNSSAATIDAVTYSSSLSSSDGVSFNLNPDGSSAGSYLKHNAISSLLSSPGKRASGGAW